MLFQFSLFHSALDGFVTGFIYQVIYREPVISLAISCLSARTFGQFARLSQTSKKFLSKPGDGFKTPSALKNGPAISHSGLRLEPL